MNLLKVLCLIIISVFFLFFKLQFSENFESGKVFVLSYENELPIHEKLILDVYGVLKHLSLSEEKAFGLDTSSVTVETVPLIIAPPKAINLKRIEDTPLHPHEPEQEKNS